MPSGPATRPLCSFEMARDTSSRVGMSVEISGFGVVAAASASSAADGAPGGWFRAASKCSRQRDSLFLSGVACRSVGLADDRRFLASQRSNGSEYRTQSIGLQAG